MTVTKPYSVEKLALDDIFIDKRVKKCYNIFIMGECDDTSAIQRT